MLLVYAHQSAASFNAAAKDAAVEELTAQGCTVEVSDLYAMKFKATATAEDIAGTEPRRLGPGVWAAPPPCGYLRCVVSAGEVKNAEHFCYGEETKLAWEGNALSADIAEEQRKLSEADLVVFQVRSTWHRCLAS